MEEPSKIMRGLSLGLIILLISAGLFSVIFVTTMFGMAEVGDAVVLVDPISRTVSEPILGPSWFVKAPWVKAVHIYYATDTFEDVIPCFSRDQLEMRMQVLIRWSLDPTKIRGLFINYPTLAYKAKAIESIMQETIRLVTKNYTALETIQYRDVVTYEIQQAVLNAIKLEPSLVDALIHLEFDLKNIEYPATYTAAIEAKLVAEQQKIQAEFERERILVLANATAQQAIIEAEGQARARVVIANSTKQAVQLIMESAGTTNSTRIAELYIYLEALMRIAPDVNILVVTTGEGGVPIIYQLPSNSTG